MTQEKKPLTYSDAGVDIDAATAALSSIKELVRRTYTEHVLRDIGTFGAMFQLDLQNYKEPVLVSSVDGVGTKLKLAFMTGKHDTVGIDLVSHCVNDILVQGARPLFFLDYFAVGKLKPEVVVEVVRGLAAGCRYAGCALIGGETAEMPDMYRDEEYDLAGTIVGIVDRSKIVDGSAIREGDVIVGLPSTGLHTNGYSLARKICFEVAGLSPTTRCRAWAGPWPRRSWNPISVCQADAAGDACRRGTGYGAHYGGGITDNLPRILPDGVAAEIDLSSWQVPPLFRFLQDTGNVADLEMLRTFNMGQGFLFVIPEDQKERVEETISLAGQQCAFVGRIVSGDGKVHYTGKLNYADTSN